jgi:DNA-binding transcriptional LysR family regulator
MHSLVNEAQAVNPLGFSMFPNLDVRHLHAVDILAEELNFTRAADRLHITQSALSKQITEIEEHHRFHLFTRKHKRHVELTQVGRLFVQEARSALLHIDRAIQLGREGSDSILTVGHSPDTDQTWVSAILAIRLPLYPKLRVQLVTQFSNELVRSVIARELNLALVTAPPGNSQVTAATFAETHLYAALPQTHAAAKRNSSRSKTWQKMNGFCSRDEFTPSFMTQFWTQHDVRESLRHTHTTLLRPNRQCTWYLNTLAWRSSPNLRPLALALKA